MHFEIIGNQISRTDHAIITTRNVNYITCEFAFDQSYRDMALYVVFYRDESLNFVLPLEEGKCLLPWELLETAGIIHIGAYGVKTQADTLLKRATTNAVVVRVVDSLTSENVPSLAPTLDVWERYRAEILGYKDEVLKIKESMGLEYDVQPTKIGVRQKGEPAFTYTDDLTGPEGPAGAIEGITSIENGGTGATNAEEARTNLGISYPNMGTVPIENGGTGATNAAVARTALGLIRSEISASNGFQGSPAILNYLNSSPQFWFGNTTTTTQFMTLMPTFSKIQVIVNNDHYLSDLPGAGTVYGILELMKGSENYKCGWLHTTSGTVYHFSVPPNTSNGSWKQVTLQ